MFTISISLLNSINLKMSEDEYEMTSFKRRKVVEDPASDLEAEEESAAQPTQVRRLKRKQIDIDDLDVLEENEGHGENVGYLIIFLINRVMI